MIHWRCYNWNALSIFVLARFSQLVGARQPCSFWHSKPTKLINHWSAASVFSLASMELLDKLAIYVTWPAIARVHPTLELTAQEAFFSQIMAASKARGNHPEMIHSQLGKWGNLRRWFNHHSAMLPDLSGTHAFAEAAIIVHTAIGWLSCLWRRIQMGHTRLHTSISSFIDRLLVQLAPLVDPKWSWYPAFLSLLTLMPPPFASIRLWSLPCSSCSQSLLCRRSLGAMISFRKWRVICGPFWLLLGSSSFT